MALQWQGQQLGWVETGDDDELFWTNIPSRFLDVAKKPQSEKIVNIEKGDFY